MKRLLRFFFLLILLAVIPIRVFAQTSAGQDGPDDTLTQEEYDAVTRSLAELGDRAASYENHDYESALKYWSEAAERGDVRSQNQVGNLYFWGRQWGGVQIIEKDYAKAVEYYQMALAQGNEDELENLTAACVYLGLESESGGDSEAALNYYRMAAGWGSEAAAMKADLLSDPEAELPDPAELTSLGLQAYSVENYAEARVWLEIAADADEPAALSKLAEMYYYGQGVPQIPEKAAELYQRSADLDDPRGIGQLAHMYGDGYGVEQSWEKAAELYGKGADLNDVFCTRNLGLMYAEGTGVEQSWAKAEELYLLAAAQGDAVAVYYLENMPEFSYSPLDSGDFPSMIRK